MANIKKTTKKAVKKSTKTVKQSKILKSSSDKGYVFNFSSLNLGCNKNLVDTQMLMGRILSFGGLNDRYEVNYIADPYDDSTDYVFLNTCGFLSSGRDEMIEVMKNLLNDGKHVIVLGCGVQYFKTLDKKTAPAVFLDPKVSFLSWSDLDKITIIDLLKGYSSKKFEDFEFGEGVRAYTNSIYGFEYLKVAEGCNNQCSFCIIPKIRGKQKSVPIEKVISEAESMIHMGIQEIIILSQDTTRYGIDLYGKPYMFELLDGLEKLPYDFSFRFMYLYPDVVTLKQLEKLQKYEKFIPYFDIPLQHISSNVLKNMGRFYDSAYIHKFLDFIFKNFETRFVRTNIIVGFPGETDADYKELKKFLEDADFDNVALFEYHDEPIAPSSKLPNKVPDDVIRKRFLELKAIVDKKLDKKQKSSKKDEKFGYVMDIEDNKLMVRPWLHAPEIDPYDEIKVSDIIGVYSDDGQIDIGSKIVYKMK